MTDDLLGGGLDIDGWSSVKQEVPTKLEDVTDRSALLRSTFPIVIKSKFVNEEERKEAHETILAALEMKSVIDVPSVAERIKRDLDKTFGSPWQVIAGESYSFSVDVDHQYLYYLIYGSIAILAFKCGSILQCEVNHLADKKQKVVSADPALMTKKRDIVEFRK